MSIRRTLFAAFLCGLWPTAVFAQSAASPMLVELFTAQGCPTCPLADEVLVKLAKRSDVVALAFHVDLWDNKGWRDQLAIPASKTRQKNYRKALRKPDVYTPQMVINGTVDFPGQDLAAVDKILNFVRARTPLGPVLTLERDGPAMLNVAVAAAPAWNDAVVWMASFDAMHTVAITRGKNRGRTAVNVNIVRDLRNLGPYSGQAWESKVDLTGVAPGQGIAVWMQPADLGPVGAAAVLPPA